MKRLRKQRKQAKALRASLARMITRAQRLVDAMNGFRLDGLRPQDRKQINRVVTAVAAEWGAPKHVMFGHARVEPGVTMRRVTISVILRTMPHLPVKTVATLFGQDRCRSFANYAHKSIIDQESVDRNLSAKIQRVKAKL